MFSGFYSWRICVTTIKFTLKKALKRLKTSDFWFKMALSRTQKLGVALATVGFFMSGAAIVEYTQINYPHPPAIVENARKAESYLASLHSITNHPSFKSRMPYDSRRLEEEFIEDIAKDETARSNAARRIKIVREDLDEMKETPKYRKFEQEKAEYYLNARKNLKRLLVKNVLGIAGYSFGIFALLGAFDWRKK